jgi:dihydrofolate reductase
MSQFPDNPGAGRPSVANSVTRVCLVAAVARNGVIGADGKLPWRLPGELRHFRQVTLGHPVIMGRRTWESLPKKPLPGRRNIVVSRTPGYAAPGAEAARSLQEALALCAGDPLASVIGGSALFAEALPRAHRLELTEIHEDYDGDTYFPAWDRGAWRVAEKETHASADGVRFDYVRYERS